MRSRTSVMSFGARIRLANMDLAAIVGPQLSGAEGYFLDRTAIPRDLDHVADAERPLHENPNPSEEVLEDVLQGETDNEADDTERREDPAKGVAGVDRDDRENADGDDRELGEVAEKDRDVRLSAVAGEHAHRRAAHPPRDEEREEGDDERPESPCAVVEEVVTDDGRIERHPAENTSALDN